jgi:hypothetical protein
MRFLSLGYDCKVKAQIRAHTGDAEAYFFDWLMSPRESLDILLRSDESLLRPGRWELVKDDTCVRDLDSGLMFMHEFPTSAPTAPGESPKVRADAVEAHLPQARAKFAYLRRKTLALLTQGDALTVVRAAELDGNEAVAEINTLRKLLLPLNPRLHFALASTRLTDHGVAENTLFFKTAAGQDWTGDAQSWGQLLQTAQRLFGEPALAAA